MKRNLFVFVICLITISATAQNFTIAEMIKFNLYNNDDLDTKATEKGFTYYNHTTSDVAESTNYKSGRGADTYYLSKSTFTANQNESISIQTNNNAWYLKMKSELKTLGFVYFDTNNAKDGTILFHYKLDNLEAVLSSWYNDDASGKYTSYQVAVVKLAEK